MKIEINYDLIDKIQQAKGEAKLKRYTKLGLKIAPPAIIGSTIGTIITGQQLNFSNVELIRQIIINSALLTAPIFISIPTTLKLIKSKTGLTPEASALMSLTALSSKLNDQNIQTTLPLLLESKEYHKEHKLVLNKDGLPCIMQNKYIMIPICDDGNIKETSVIQEHKIGTNKYVLTLGSPVKTKQFKPAYGI